MDKQSQLMLITLPNSGSDWLAPLIAEAAGMPYAKDFFSPICSPEYRQALEPLFGCEMVSCYENIGVTSDGIERQLDDVYNATWRNSGLRMTKDVFNFRKMPWFSKHFAVATLYRSPAISFPPSRRRVQVWYDAIHIAMRLEGRERPLRDRVVSAAVSAWHEILALSESHSAPIIDASVLLESPQELVFEHIRPLGELIEINLNQLAESICRTRRQPSRDRYWG